MGVLRLGSDPLSFRRVSTKFLGFVKAIRASRKEKERRRNEDRLPTFEMGVCKDGEGGMLPQNDPSGLATERNRPISELTRVARSYSATWAPGAPEP
jgi:hypothetical protein